MPEITMDMLLSGTKPASAPVQAAQGAPGLRGGAVERETGGEGDSFSHALSRQMEGAEPPAETVDKAPPGEEPAASSGGEGTGEEMTADGEAAASAEEKAEAEANSEAEAETEEEAVVETRPVEVELPPGLTLMDLPVATVALPAGGNGLPAGGTATPSAKSAATELPRPAELLAEAGEGEGLASRRRTVADAVAAAVDSSAEGDDQARSFGRLLNGGMAATTPAPTSADGAAGAAPPLGAVATPTGSAPALQTGAPAPAPGTVRAAIDTPFRQPGWNDSLGNRVVWMANEKIEKAEIRLNPPTLGPIEVRVTMNGDQASVSFVAQNASVRDALEQALPRLREMMGDNGVNLAEADVSDAHRDSRAREGDGDGGGRGTGRGGGGGDAEDLELGEGQAVSVGNGMLDLYA